MCARSRIFIQGEAKTVFQTVHGLQLWSVMVSERLRLSHAFIRVFYRSSLLFCTFPSPRTAIEVTPLCADDLGT